ncbi:MAG: M20 family metallopeptidase [Pirellulaceae bacterium]
MKKTLRYASRLIEFDTVSHKSNGLISRYLEMKLAKHGFVVEKVNYTDARNVKKVCLVAKKGTGQGGLAYACHVDTVPADNWNFPKSGPFAPMVHNDRLYGRGSCDMKGSIACMLSAAQVFDWEQLKRPLYFICTADEEVGFHGARAVVAESEFYKEMVEHQTKCIIGEPTGLEVVHGHKGSYVITAVSIGKEAHSSSREGKNANLAMIPFLNQMLALYDLTERDAKWHDTNFDPPTLSMNIGIRDNATALNVKVGRSTATIYLRPMPNIDVEPILKRVQQIAEHQSLELTIRRACEPFWKNPSSEFVQQTLKLLHRSQSKTVSYATDAGVFVGLTNKIILGPGNIAQAHTSDEWISLDQLNRGAETYAKMIQLWCCE